MKFNGKTMTAFGHFELGEDVYAAGKAEMHNIWLAKALTELNEPNVTEIGAYQFYAFEMLERAIFPSVTTAGAAAFRGCPLVEAYFPMLGVIPDQLFYSAKFRIFDAPIAVSVGSSAFSYNSNLVALILRNEDAVVSLDNKNAFTNTRINSGNGGYVYVPRALLDDNNKDKDYRQATNWTNFASRFRVLEDYTVDGTTTGALDESKI